MLETTIPKGMALSTESVSNIKDTTQLHQPWYQHMNDREEATTIRGSIFTLTAIILMSFTILHFRLMRKELITLALMTTLTFHRQVSHTSCYTYSMYKLFWIIWVTCKQRKKKPEKIEIKRLTYHSQHDQQKSNNTIQLPNMTKILNNNAELRSEINRTKGLLAKTISKNVVLSNQATNLETMMKSMESKIRNLRNISVNSEGKLKHQLNIQTGLRNTVRKTKQALTQATIELSLKEKTLQRYKITKSRQDEDNHNLQERNKQLVLDYINMTDENHELIEKMKEVKNSHKNEIRKYKELQEKERMDTRKTWDLCIQLYLNHSETLQQKETLKETLARTLLEHQKILESKDNKTRRLQEKIRKLYNENTNYKLKLEGPYSSLDLLDKILITTKHMRQEMTTSPKKHETNGCEPMDDVLISTLCMREKDYQNNSRITKHEKLIKNQKDECRETQSTKTCKKQRNVNIPHQGSRTSTKTVILGGLAMMLLFITKSTKATSYPYTEVKPLYSHYMKPSSTAIKNMRQIITQTNKLIKSDNVHQSNRMVIINEK